MHIQQYSIKDYKGEKSNELTSDITKIMIMVKIKVVTQIVNKNLH